MLEDSHPRGRVAIAVIAGLTIWLAACNEEPSSDQSPNMASVLTGDDMVVRPADKVAPVDPKGARPGSSTGAVPTQAASAAESGAAAEKGEQGARNVLLAWAHALERRDWRAARAQWGHGGKDSGLDEKAFADAYGKYRRLTVVYGDGRVEGAAGSLFYQVPVTITGVTDAGEPVRMEGPVTLRRVNDVPGATPEELRWHISRSALKPPPVS